MPHHHHSAAPCCLKVEYKSNPLGMDEPHPRFDYRLCGNVSQSARQIMVRKEDGTTVWDSGWVNDGESLQIQYEGKELEPFTRYCWQVRIRDLQGVIGPWSDGENWFETGFLGTPWQDSRWICAPSPWHGPGQAPRLMEREFRLPRRKIVSARLYATALGCYNAELNGQPVTEDIFTPGWTEYRQRVQYQAYDVTGLLRQGGNRLEVTLADGWYCGRIARLSDYTGYEPKFRCELHIRFTDGSVTRIGTSSEFQCHVFGGPIRTSDIYDGETVEMWRNRKWLQNNSPLTAAAERDAAPAIVWNSGAPVRRLQFRAPEKIIRRKNGNYIVDFGQNLTGRERITLQNTVKGDTIVINHGEMLRPDGTVYTENLRSARAVSTFVCDNARECVLEAVFTYYGFRYLEISGLRGRLTAKNICAVVISSDLPRTGLFSCSEPLLNKLFENTGWGMRSNFLDIPTDCPQRDERLGWTCDTHIFCNTASFNAYVPEFYTKWLTDLETDRKLYGCYPDISPMLGGIKQVRFRPVTGWSDAGIIVPWMLCCKYNDTRILERNFDGMLDYMRLCVRDVIDKNIKDGYYVQYDDWLNHEDPTSHEFLAVAYIAGMLDLMMQIATRINKKSALRWLQATSRRVRSFFAGNFIIPGKGLKEKSQCAMLMALHWNLLPDKYVKSTLRALEKDIRSKRGLHLATGFLGTPLLLPVLSRHGLHDLAGELLMQTDFPGWLYPITQGATTMWERWNSYSHEDGFGDVSMNSFNHYAYGAVVEWFYEYLGGIRNLTKGGKSFTLAPLPCKELEYAEITFCSPYGPIVSCWQKKGSRIIWDFSVPANSTAIIIPPGRKMLSFSGTGEVTRGEDGQIIASPGEYSAECSL